MKLITIEAKTLPDAWFQCCRKVMEEGREYVITSGSFPGQKRKEFDMVSIRVEFPGSLPMVPDTPQGVPPPTTMDYVEKYLPYLVEAKTKENNELYTYGDDLSIQIPEIVKKYENGGFDNNQCCMSVGNAQSIFLEHSQCLRLIDTRILNGSLNFIVYFRSWDLWAGFPSNLAAIQIMKNYMADLIGVKDGELLAFSKGLHLYDHCWDLARVVTNLEVSNEKL